MKIPRILGGLVLGLLTAQAAAQNTSLFVNGVSGANGTTVSVATGSTILLQIDNFSEANQPYGLFGALANNGAGTGWYLDDDGLGKDVFPVLTGVTTTDVSAAFGEPITPFRLGSPLITLDQTGCAELQLIVPTNIVTPATFFIQVVVEDVLGGFDASNGIQIDVDAPDQSARLLVSQGASVDDVEFGVLEFTMGSPGAATYTASAISGVDVQDIALADQQEFHPHDYRSGDSLADRPRDVDVFTGNGPALQVDNDAFPRVILPAAGSVPPRDLLRVFDPVGGAGGLGEGFFLVVQRGDNPSAPGDFLRLPGLQDSGDPTLNSIDQIVGVNADGTRLAAVFHDSGLGTDQVVLFALDGTTPFGGFALADITPPDTQTVDPRSIVFTTDYVFFVIDDGMDAVDGDMDGFSHRLFHAELDAGGGVPVPVETILPEGGDPDEPAPPDVIPARGTLAAPDGSLIVLLGGNILDPSPIDNISQGDWFSVLNEDPTTAINITQLPALTGDVTFARFWVPGGGFDGTGGYASLSPDGTMLAFVANHDNQLLQQEDDEVYAVLTNGGSVNNVLINSSATTQEAMDSNANTDLDNAQDVCMVDANNMLFFYGEDDGATQAMDLFHYDVTTGITTNLTQTGDPVPVTTAGDIHPEGYFRSPSGRYFYFVRGFEAGVSADRANLVGVDTMTGDVFNVTGAEFGGFTQLDGINEGDYGENFSWHLVQAGGALDNLIYFASGVDGVTTAQNAWVFDAEFPFLAFRFTNNTTPGLEIESLTPRPSGFGAGWAWTTGTSDAMDVYVSDLSFGVVDDLSETGFSGAFPLGALHFVPPGQDGGGEEIAPGLLFAQGTNAADNPTDASFSYVDVTGPNTDFTVDPIVAAGLGAAAVQIYHASID